MQATKAQTMNYSQICECFDSCLSEVAMRFREVARRRLLYFLMNRIANYCRPTRDEIRELFERIERDASFHAPDDSVYSDSSPYVESKTAMEILAWARDDFKSALRFGEIDWRNVVALLAERLDYTSLDRRTDGGKELDALEQDALKIFKLAGGDASDDSLLGNGIPTVENIEGRNEQ